MSKVGTIGAASSRTSHAQELRELGFPEAVVEEASRAHEQGLFSMAPSPDLLRRTVERCQGLLPRPAAPRPPDALTAPEHIADVLAAYYMAVAGLDEVMGQFRLDTNRSHVLSSVGHLASECLATVGFVHETRQRPVMLIDNHNVVNPVWWASDTGFVAMRDALETVNCAAHRMSAPLSAVIMVLRPNIDDYAEGDLRVLGTLLDTATSDVWMMPHGHAGMYEDQDVVVFGDERVLRLQERCATPVAALGAFREEFQWPVLETRAGIEALTEQATEARQRGGISADGGEKVRALLDDVISGGQTIRMTAA